MILKDDQLGPLADSLVAGARAFNNGPLDSDSLEFSGEPDDVSVYAKVGGDRFHLRHYKDGDGNTRTELYKQVADIGKGEFLGSHEPVVGREERERLEQEFRSGLGGFGIDPSAEVAGLVVYRGELDGYYIVEGEVRTEEGIRKFQYRTNGKRPLMTPLVE